MGEVPPPFETVRRALEAPGIRSQIGVDIAPLSFQLWHGHVGTDFARFSVPLLEAWAPFPSVLPWVSIYRKRTEVQAAVALGPQGWVLLQLSIQDDSLAAERKPLRTQDIVAAETGSSVPTT